MTTRTISRPTATDFIFGSHSHETVNYNEASSERKDGKTASLDLNYGGMSLECSTRVELAAHLTA